MHGLDLSDQIAQQLARASIFALPSHAEGVPMALLESMAGALPPVTTPVGGIPEVVQDGHNGLLVTPGDSSALAASLGRLLADGVFRTRLEERARATIAQSYSRDAASEKLLLIFAGSASTTERLASHMQGAEGMTPRRGLTSRRVRMLAQRLLFPLDRLSYAAYTAMRRSKVRAEPLELDSRLERILILSPHQDDELLGCGGFLVRHGRQRRIQVVYVADGGGAIGRAADARHALAQQRNQEAREDAALCIYTSRRFWVSRTAS